MANHPLVRRTPPKPLVACILAVVAAVAIACVPRARIPVEPSWITDNTLPGVRLFHPGDWRARADASSGLIELTGSDHARAFVWPFFVPGQLTQQGARTVLSSLAHRALPGVRWTGWQMPGASAARMVGRTRNDRSTAFTSWMVTAEGTAGTVYIASAAESSYQRLRPTFAGIFRGFRLTVGFMDRTRGSRYTLWRDPTEGAFSMEIPAGWKARGGVIRPRDGQRFIYSEVKLTSPDGAIVLYLGDGFPSFSEPNRTRRSGTSYGARGQFFSVEPYLPGATFVVKYALPLIAPGFEVIAERNRPDLAGILVRHGVSRYDAGEVDYRFVLRGQAYRGGSLCITEEMAGRTDPIAWNVWRLLLFQGPEDRYGEAASIAVHLAASFRVEPSWIQANLPVLGQAGRNIAGNGVAMGSVVSSGAWARLATDEMLLRRQAASAEPRYVIGSNGQRIEVDLGAGYFWIDERGRIAGTQLQIGSELDFASML
jgi:hypothetical protein